MDSPDSPAGFDRLGLAPAVLQAVTGLGYEVPTPIQAECIPHLLAGRDLLGQAQTGTGKTAAFALPLLSRIELEHTEPQVLVLTPTRELALQVAEAFQRYAHHLPGFHVVPIYGGQSFTLQIRQLRQGAQVIVGTPGRVMDHIRRGTLTLTGIRTLVLDEADEMLDMGFAEDIEWVFGQAPSERQVALFSATMPPAIRRVADAHLSDPVTIHLGGRTQTVETIEQHHCLVTRHHKLDLLTRILEVDPFDAMLIFVRTKTATQELKERLVAHGFTAEALNGDMTQELREAAVERLRRSRLDILVATDVAARGLDVERISHVVNYDIPTDPSAYVHRIGRTGRAGRQGRAVLFVEPRERRLLHSIEGVIGQRIPPMDPPSAEAVSESRIGHFTEQMRNTLDTEDLDFFYRLIARIAHEQELDVMDIAAALAFLGQRGRPLEVQDLQTMPRRTHDRRTREEGHPSRPERSAERHRRDDTRPPRRERRGRDDDEVPMVHYRIEVGRDDGVSPREIVGAIANEAGLEGRYIGRIDIRDDHCIVDLPDGMPKDIYRHLKNVIVCGKALRLHPADAERPEHGPQERRDTRAPHRAEREPRSNRQHGKSERPRREHGGPAPRHRRDDRPPRGARPRPPKRKG